jgi:hypothetical protein
MKQMITTDASEEHDDTSVGHQTDNSLEAMSRALIPLLTLRWHTEHRCRLYRRLGGLALNYRDGGTGKGA